MPNIEVTVLPQYGQPLYNLSWRLTTEKPPPHYDNRTAQQLDVLLREELSFDDDAIQKIMLDIETHGKHIGTHRVDDETYKRLSAE